MKKVRGRWFAISDGIRRKGSGANTRNRIVVSMAAIENDTDRPGSFTFQRIYNFPAFPGKFSNDGESRVAAGFRVPPGNLSHRRFA